MTTAYGIPLAAGLWPDGWTVLHVAETGSTNADLLALAGGPSAADAEPVLPDKLVLVADHQTAGRGRLDRRWEAPPGANLLLSVLLRDIPPHIHEVTQRVALAAAAACHRVAVADLELKWPNDLLLHGHKVAGILAQAGTVDGHIDHVVVGIGINVAWAPEGAACLHDVSSDVDRWDLVRALLREFDRLAAIDVPAAYREHLATIGQQVRVHLPGDEVLDGTAIGVEDDGRLVVLDSCAVTHRIDTGDVVHLRPG
jgi:BirA family biotin operon repressor/biotin-[acetyl-CoA-carboxylase] ligase